MIESTTQAPEKSGELTGIYDTPYALDNGCLSIERTTKSGVYYTRLCNFAPKIVSEVTVDDGAELTRKYLIGGTDSSGRELPLVEVAATELEKMEWMLNHWDASLDLDVVPQVQRHVRRAIKSTATHASKKSVFAHTGWKKIDGKYFFLLPGNEKYDVELKGSLQSYGAATSFREEDLAFLSGFLYSDFIPHAVSFPCLSLVFLTPLNEFLRRVGHEPKFIPDTEGTVGSVSGILASGDDVSAGAVCTPFRDGDTRADASDDVYELCQPSGMARGMDENTRQGYEKLGGHDQSPSAISSRGEQGNLVTGWEEARRIYEEALCDHGREGIDNDEADLGYEMVDHRDDVLVGHSLSARIRDHLSADELKAFFEGDENMRDDLPFDDEDDELLKSLRDLQYQARNGNVYAMYRLSRIYLDESSKYYHEVWGNYFLEQSAEGGYHVAQYRIGKMLYYGIRYEQDIESAADWLSRSAVSGNLYGATLLGKIYVEDSFFGAKRDEGFRMLFEAERNGNEFAAYTLGKYYMEGKVVKKDIAKAIEHLEIASARGNMYADYRLAQIYLFEADIFDMEKALEYLNRSAHAGNESAALALTRMANNQFLAVATNVLDLIGSLASIESYRQPQDCTTMPISRKERKKHEWEQSM